MPFGQGPQGYRTEMQCRGAVPSRPRGLRHQEKVASCIPCVFVNVPSVSSTSSGTAGGMVERTVDRVGTIGDVSG